MYPQRPNLFDYLPSIDLQFFLDNMWLTGTLIGLVAIVCLWEFSAFFLRRRRERILDVKLQERIAARASNPDTSAEMTDFFQEEETGDIDEELLGTKNMLVTWESATLSMLEQDHMRERSAFHARQWLQREIEEGDINPLAQSHFYNLLYSLRNAETQIQALREAQDLKKTVNLTLAGGRTKPRVKLVLPKAAD